MTRRLIKVTFMSAVLLLLARSGYAVETPDSVRTGREFDLKTNLLMDATASPSLGIEYGIGRKWSVDVSASYNPWTFSNNRKWKHWLVQPELRWWSREAMDGMFLGLHGVGVVYNLNKVDLPFGLWPDLAERRHEGWGVGAGIGIGWRHNLSRCLAVESEIGVGYVYSEYDVYCPKDCGFKTGSEVSNYFGLTKMSLGLVWRFGAAARALRGNAVEGTIREARAAAAAAEPAGHETVVRESIIVRESDNRVEIRDEKPPVQPKAASVVHDTVYIRDTVVLSGGRSHAKFRTQTYILRLQYRQGSAQIQRELGDNQRHLVDFKEFVDRIQRDSSNVIQRVSLTGWCSIEGTARFNDRLSLDRAHGVEEYLLGFYPWMRDIMYVEGRGEDWVGLLRLVEASGNTPWSREIERIILGAGVYQGREKRLMDLYGGHPYRWMARDLFPQLRRIECVVEYSVRED